MSLSLRYAARSHVGLIRDGNEDSGYASSRLLVIADGMGGQAAGEIASAVAVQTLAELDSPHTTGLTGDPVRDLDDRIKLANNKIRAIITQNPELEGMGTTVTALFLAGGNHFAFGHIGDSRAYRLRGGALEQISTDHTWVQRLIDEGQITEDEAGRHPQRSLLMRALGTTSEVDLDLTVLDAQVGDRYLLCSDGLSGFVPFNTLATTLAGYGDPHHAAETLIQHALRGGGADNITCIVADVYEQSPTGARTASQAETQYLELPVIVGAAAEEEANATSLAGAANPQPAPATDPNVTGMFAAAAAAEPGAAPPPPPGVDGREDTAELEAVEAEPARRRWVRPAAIAGACVVVLGGLGAAAYLWTQQQYYVGADSDGHVAIYQGVDYSLAGIKLSHVYTAESVTVAGLPSSQQSQVRSSITTDGLSEARSIVSSLSVLESECSAFTTAQSAPTPPAPIVTPPAPAVSGSPSGTPSDKASGSASDRASGSSSPRSTGTSTDTATKSPSTTPTPSVAPSSSVSSGNAELHQLSAQCPADAD